MNEVKQVIGEISKRCTSDSCGFCVFERVFERDFKDLVGQVLTQIEATVSDTSQREAQKSLARRTLYEWSDLTIRRMGTLLPNTHKLIEQ